MRIFVLSLAACSGAADTPSPIKTGDTGDSDTDTDSDTDSDTDTDSDSDTDCAADATDALGLDPWFDAWNSELLFRTISGFTSFQGAFQDKPSLRFQVETEREGLCRLETYTPSSCTPVCSGTELCIDGICEDQPRRLSGGTLTLSGPIEPPPVISPDALDGYYFYTYEPVNGDAEIVLSGTAGEDVPAFTAITCPVTAVEPEEDWSESLAAREPGEDVVLTWDNIEPQARVRLRMTTGIATHGGIAHAEIACEGPDTGSLTLPGPFLDVLYAEGWSCGECGLNDLIRYRSGQIGETGSVFSAEGVTQFFYIP